MTTPLLVVNLYGGPGARKSTLAAMIAGTLKMKSVSCELVGEAAKDMVYDESLLRLRNQIQVLGEQSHRIRRLMGKVDVAVSDSPVLLSPLYNGMYSAPIPGVSEAARFFYRECANADYLIRRAGSYDPAGRIQTEQEALKIDRTIRAMFAAEKIPFVEIPGTMAGVRRIVSDVIGRLAQGNALR